MSNIQRYMPHTAVKLIEGKLFHSLIDRFWLMIYSVESLKSFWDNTNINTIRPFQHTLPIREGYHKTFLIKFPNRNKGISNFRLVQDLCKLELRDIDSIWYVNCVVTEIITVRGNVLRTSGVIDFSMNIRVLA
jgi:hypothetical protein